MRKNNTNDSPSPWPRVSKSPNWKSTTPSNLTRASASSPSLESVKLNSLTAEIRPRDRAKNAGKKQRHSSKVSSSVHFRNSPPTSYRVALIDDDLHQGTLETLAQQREYQRCLLFIEQYERNEAEERRRFNEYLGRHLAAAAE